MKMKSYYVIILVFIMCSSVIVSGVNTIKKDTKTQFEEPSGFLEWEKTYDSEKYDVGNCIQQINDGGYICVGEGDGYKVWLFKINEFGTIIWSKFFQNSYPDYARYVLQTDDNGYIILAETEINNFQHVWLIKTDENGNKTWERFYRYKQESSGFCIQSTSDNGYIITGYASPLNWLNCYDVWLLKVNNTGYEEWNKTYERPNYNRAYSVKQTPDDGYIIVGGKCLNLDSEADIWLIKTDLNGNLQWEKTFGNDSTWNMGRCVQLTSDGGYIIAGEQLLLKTDAEGNEEWCKPIGSMCAQQTIDGGYILTGFKYYWWKDFFKDRDLKITKTDAYGNIEWTRIYGGKYKDSGNFILQTKDNGFIIIGYTEFEKNFPCQERDIWIIKTGEEPIANNYNSIPILNKLDYYSKGFFINYISKILQKIYSR